MSTLTGKLRERVTFQTKTRVRDAIGGSDYTWANSFTAWAKVEEKKAEEKFQHGQHENIVDLVVTTRFRREIADDMRIVWRDRVLEIRGLLFADYKREFYTIECVEGEPH